MMILQHSSILLVLLTVSQSSDARQNQSKLLGFRISNYSSFLPFSCSEDMLIPELSEGTEVTIRIVGHLADVKSVALTPSVHDCNVLYPETIVPVEKESDEVGSITLRTPTNLSKKKTILYYCFRTGETLDWNHQGVSYWAQLIIVQRQTTVYTIVIGCILSIIFAAIMKASILGLLSMDMEALRAKAENGTEKEKIVSRVLIGLRKRGYLLLMIIIPGIVAFKTTLTVFLRILFNGWLATILSTVLIVMFVEIVPRIRDRSENVDPKEKTLNPQ